MHSGDVAYNTIDSLSAFWPGLQVLSGDIQSAIKLHMICMFNQADIYLHPPTNNKTSDYNLWRQHSGLPEVYDTSYMQATSHQYPLRPGKHPCPHRQPQVFIDCPRRIYRVHMVFVSSKDVPLQYVFLSQRS